MAGGLLGPACAPLPNLWRWPSVGGLGYRPHAGHDVDVARCEGHRPHRLALDRRDADPGFVWAAGLFDDAPISAEALIVSTQAPSVAVRRTQRKEVPVGTGLIHNTGDGGVLQQTSAIGFNLTIGN